MASLTLEMVEPLLALPLSEPQRTRVRAWLVAIEAVLSRRYSADVMAETPEVFATYAADAVGRKLSKSNQLADSEQSGPFSVRWNAASSRGGWFLPAELAELDGLMGRGGARTYRTPAPDAQRYGNTFGAVDVDDETLTEIAREAL